MKNLLIFNLGRRSRTLAAPALALAALAILLLGIGSELPTASASALSPARPENATSAISSYIYFPIMFYTETPPVNWVDEFTNKYTGWVAAGDGCTGQYDTDKGRYKVTISAGHKYDSCIIYNLADDNPNLYRSPLGSFPLQFEGTFRVKVRRTSSDSYPLMYGLQFDTAANSSDANGTRWALVAWPQDTDSGCPDDKGFYWLTAQQWKDDKDGGHNTSMYYSVDDAGVSGCTSTIDLDEDDWNQIAAIRSGNTIKVYLNDYNSSGDINHTYSHSFTSVPTIYPKDHSEALGWTQMRVVPYSNSQVTVEFERIEILSSTTAPW
jgi:hypothetical protein